MATIYLVWGLSRWWAVSWIKTRVSRLNLGTGAKVALLFILVVSLLLGLFLLGPKETTGG
jgi:hypothetical protein